jgi:hypothetical protein
MSRERDVVHTLGAEADLPRAARPILMSMIDIKEGRRAMLRSRMRRSNNEKWKCGGFRGARHREVIWAGVGAWIPWHLPSTQSQHLHFAQLFHCQVVTWLDSLYPCQHFHVGLKMHSCSSQREASTEVVKSAAHNKLPSRNFTHSDGFSSACVWSWE